MKGERGYLRVGLYVALCLGERLVIRPRLRMKWARFMLVRIRVFCLMHMVIVKIDFERPYDGRGLKTVSFSLLQFLNESENTGSGRAVRMMGFHPEGSSFDSSSSQSTSPPGNSLMATIPFQKMMFIATSLTKEQKQR